MEPAIMKLSESEHRLRPGSARALLRRPLSQISETCRNGTKSATDSSMVNMETETGVGNVEVVQQIQMQDEASTRRSSRPPKSRLVKYSCTESKGSGKSGALGDNEDATGSRIMQSPINLFIDECVFCHSFRKSEFHGPMVQYLKGRVVSSNKGNPTNAIYVHEKCIKWAPRVRFNGDTVLNMKKEIRRASGLKCSRCSLPGAALGCCIDKCAKTYHVPCALMIPECRWDPDNRNVWCPDHASSEALPCDAMPILESDISSSDHHKEDDQVDQLNTSSSSLPQRQFSNKDGISAGYHREEKEINKPSTLRSCPSDQWVLLGAVLSESEKDSLKEFASLTNATVVDKWEKNVTHVIVGRYGDAECRRSYEVLMAILSGKWVVKAGWIEDCLGELILGQETCLSVQIPVSEISYEVKFLYGSRTSIDGPTKGRARAAEEGPKLFAGLYFCLSAYLDSQDRENIQDLIAAADGQVLEGSNYVHLSRKDLDRNSVKLYFIYNGESPKKFTSSFLLDLQKEMEECIQYRDSGAQVISNLMLFDAIASYNTQILEPADHLASDMSE
ncbi:BRCA1-associated RING domain protein 1 isoform X3 [Brachypodium distachyon]|uniref:BRCA1-associated RING domain protein 1 isoform X3 n=1 Tax=Brachypodium distachyon TaxID=15368 RepID=UPI000D0DB219|nr:BRCA1-associated RING domain protein 1 isoform X3 [Brachypodium distachyon]|eukprot:XP_024313987.1 BRCA1-associated RING domain protein 1 isoform X3 [Brachypodium distachyon]